MILYDDHEEKLLDLVKRLSITSTLGSVQNQRLVFGGVRGSGGGAGGPIQTFIGKLKQTDITFDVTESGNVLIPAGEAATLLNNLNRIRSGLTIVPYSGIFIPQVYTVAEPKTLLDHLEGIDNALGSITGLLPLYLYDNVSADIAGYRKLDDSKSGEAESTVTSAGLVSGTTLIDEWVTVSGLPNLDIVPDGTSHVHLHAAQTAGTKDATLHAALFKRNTAGTETQIGDNSHETATLTGSVLEYNLHITNPNDTSMLTSDRIVLKLYVNVTGPGSAPTVVLHMEGDTESRVEIPAPALAGGAGGGGHTIQDEGTPLTQRTNLNFVGASVTVTDDAGNDATVVEITASGGGTWPYENFWTVGPLGTYATIAAAIAGSPPAGTVLLLDAGTHSVNGGITLPSGVHLGCKTKNAAHLTCNNAQYAITAGNGSVLFNFSAENTHNMAAHTATINVPYPATLYNIDADGHNDDGSFYIHAINVSASSCDIINCDARTTNSPFGLGLFATVPGVNVRVQGGRISGAGGNSLDWGTGADIYIYGTRIVDGFDGFDFTTFMHGFAYDDATGRALIFGTGGAIQQAQLSATPSSPTSQTWKLYPKSTGWHSLDETGNEIPLEPLYAGTPTTLTIQNHVEGFNYISITRHYHIVSTGGDASENLDCITGGVSGDVLILRPQTTGQTVVLKHNSAAALLSSKMFFSSGADISLGDNTDHIILVHDGTYWCDIFTGVNSGTSWPFTNKVLTVDSGGDADYTTVAGAIGGANTIDTILLSSDIHAAPGLTAVPSGIALVGLATENFVIAGTDTGTLLNTNSVVQDITRVRTGSGTNVVGFATNGSSTGVVLRNVNVNVSGGSATNYGVSAPASGASISIYGGKIVATGTGSYAINVASGATCYLYGPILSGASGVVNNAGTCKGWYYDTDGNIFFLNNTSDWTAWTPTVTQSGSVAATVTKGRYRIIDGLCFVEIYLDVTGTGTGNNAISIGGQPAAIQQAVNSQFQVGTVVDTGIGSYYGIVFVNGATDWRFIDTTTKNFIGINPNFALANGDIIQFRVFFGT